MSDVIQIPEGTFGTGLQMPLDGGPEFPLYRDQGGPMYTMDELGEILSHPSRVDKRKQFPADKWIYNQGSIGSCNGCAGALALQRLRVLQGQPLVELSGEGLYAQINRDSRGVSRDRGSQLADGMDCIQRNGVPPRELVPRMEYRYSSINPQAWEEAKRFKGAECFWVAPDDDIELELASGLAAGFMGVVAVQANNQFSRIDSDGVVLETNGVGNHAVGIHEVRIRNRKLEFDHFGSWGTRLHADGYGYLTHDRHFRITKRNHRFFLIRIAKQDPNADNPH